VIENIIARKKRFQEKTEPIPAILDEAIEIAFSEK
jgi:hypothetical protein